VPTRIDVGGPGKSLGTITDKLPGVIPAAILTRIAVGGVGRTYVVTDKAPGGPIIPRPGDILTKIGVGGVGIYYIVTDKAETPIIDRDTNGYYGTGIVRERRKRDEEEILAIIMASYEVIH